MIYIHFLDSFGNNSRCSKILFLEYQMEINIVRMLWYNIENNNEILR